MHKRNTVFYKRLYVGIKKLFFFIAEILSHPKLLYRVLLALFFAEE
jgi:hypothetical protein